MRRHSQDSFDHKAPMVFQSGKAKGWLLAALLAAVAVGAAWWQTHPSGDDPSTAPAAGNAAGTGAKGSRRFGGSSGVQPVSVRAARQQDIHIVVNAIGNLAASNTAVVRAQVSGVLQSLNFQEGQQVQAGQLLAQIDPRAFVSTAAQAEGALARDSAQLENAKIDLARYKDLFSKDAAPKQQLDTQAALVRQLEGTVKVDQATLAGAQLQLSYTRVVAPISGRTGLKQVDLGNIVQPSDINGIVSISQTRPIAMVFAVSASQVPLLQKMLAAKQVPVVQAWDKGGNRQLAIGRVSSIDNAIDASTDTIKVKAVFPNADDALFPNQSVGVRLQLDTLKAALAVPKAAVLRGAQGFFVYVVEADNTVSTRAISPGVVDGEWMAVEGAVQAGDKVVVDGVDRLRNGAKVEVIEPNAKVSGAGGGKWGGMGEGKPGAEGKSSVASAPTGAADRKATASSATEKPTNSNAPDVPASGSDADSERRRAFFQNLSSEEREKIKAMSPEERQAWREKMRAQREKSGGAAN
jgi:multidrug efflux system membrane fusion protein